MTAYVINRLIQAVFVIFIVTVLIFVAMRFLPGDPIIIYVGEQEISVITPELKAKLMEEFGLNKPLILQYIDWMSGVLRGDFGTSIHYRESVGKLLMERLPVTLYVGLIAYVISSVVGVFFGLLGTPTIRLIAL